MERSGSLVQGNVVNRESDMKGIDWGEVYSDVSFMVMLAIFPGMLLWGPALVIYYISS